MTKEHTDDWGPDDLGNLIAEIARRRLPDGVLSGILAGKEGEIRQDVATMLLQGILVGDLGFVKAAGRDRSAAISHLERVASIALKLCRNRLIRRETEGKLPPG